MKRHVYLPDRTVSVEDGTVRDLDGTVLGEVERFGSAAMASPGWYYAPGDLRFRMGPYRTRADALRSLLSDSRCPTPGPNRYDR